MMKTIQDWNGLREFGIELLTGEACSLTYRLLFDLTANGKRVVERCLSVKIESEPWNRGSKDDPHVASILLVREFLTPLSVFALLEAGCTEVWLAERGVFGIEPNDTPREIEAAKRVYQATRRFRYGEHGDRNQHAMSGRIV